MTLIADVETMEPSTNKVLAAGTEVNVKFNVYNAGDEKGEFHCVVYIGGQLACQKQGEISPNHYRPDMLCSDSFYVRKDASTKIKFVGGYALGGVWKNTINVTVTVSTIPTQYGKFKIQVMESRTSNRINNANVCLKASGASIGCKKTSYGVTDWFSNVGLDRWITGTITKTGFVTYEVLGFSVASYNGQTLTYYMSKKEELGAIKISSSPSGAKAYINGYYKGITPVTISNLPDYVHAVYVTLAGYKTPTHKDVKVIAGQTVNASFTLDPISNGDIETELSWDVEPATSIGVGIDGIFKFKLKEKRLGGTALSGGYITLIVNGTDTSIGGKTDGSGKVTLRKKFSSVGSYTVFGRFKGLGNYKADDSPAKTIKVTAPKSAYLVTARNLPAGKTYRIKAYCESVLPGSWQHNPNKIYDVTSVNETCEILREDMDWGAGKQHTIRLFDETGNRVYETLKPIRALKSTLDRLPVYLDANVGKKYRINMSNVPDTPAVNKAFDIGARLIIGQSTPAGAGQSIIFKEEVAEGQYSEIGTRETDDFGIAKYRHPGKAEEGGYNFIATFEYEETTCDVHTVTVGEKPSGFEDFLTPLFKWVEEAFNVDEKTAKTYTYVGIGVLGLALLGGFLK